MTLVVLLIAMLALGALAPNAGGEDVDVVPRLNGEISGRTIWLDSELPVALASVSLAETLIRTVTDAEGYFRIENVPAGTHTVIIRAPGSRRFELHGVKVEWSKKAGIAWPLRLAPCRCGEPNETVVVAMNDTTRVVSLLEGPLEPRFSATAAPYFAEIPDKHGPCYGRSGPRSPFGRRVRIDLDEVRAAHIVQTRLERRAVTSNESWRQRLSN